jgi:hypothetical protein
MRSRETPRSFAAIVLPLTLTLLALNCGGDGGGGAIAPEAPATQRVTLQFVGLAWSNGGPLEGVVVEYRVAPCSYLEECEWRVTADTTDGQGRYSISAARTCILDQNLSIPGDSVRSDALSAFLPLSATEMCFSADHYGPSSLTCTNATQEMDFDLSHCNPAAGL